MFHKLLAQIESNIAQTILKVGLVEQPSVMAGAFQKSGLPAAEASAKAGLPVRVKKIKIGRNNPCPCGSNKKYKKCCGR